MKITTFLLIFSLLGSTAKIYNYLNHEPDEGVKAQTELYQEKTKDTTNRLKIVEVERI